MRNAARFFVPALVLALVAGWLWQWAVDRGDDAPARVESTRLAPELTTAAGEPKAITQPALPAKPAQPTQPAERDVSIVAAAVVAIVDVFDDPLDTAPKASLGNPIPSGGPLIFLVDGQRSGWLKVLLPLRPNGSVGWIQAKDVALTRHTFRIDVKLSAFRLELYHNGKIVDGFPIGVAKDNTPTPGGRFYTTELLRPPEPDSAYGRYAYGMSGYSDVLKSFNGGPGQLGLHGTNDDASIGTRVSSGCIRMHNDDIEKLVAVLPLGVPVTIMA